MTPEQHNAQRVRACSVMRELGAWLDALANAAETQRLPGDPAADALIVHQHLSEACCALDTLCTHAGDALQEMETLVERADLAAAPFLAPGKGGAS